MLLYSGLSKNLNNNYDLFFYTFTQLKRRFYNKKLLKNIFIIYNKQ